MYTKTIYKKILFHFKNENDGKMLFAKLSNEIMFNKFKIGISLNVFLNNENDIETQYLSNENLFNEISFVILKLANENKISYTEIQYTQTTEKLLYKHHPINK